VTEKGALKAKIQKLFEGNPAETFRVMRVAGIMNASYDETRDALKELHDEQLLLNTLTGANAYYSLHPDKGGEIIPASVPVCDAVLPENRLGGAVTIEPPGYLSKEPKST